MTQTQELVSHVVDGAWWSSINQPGCALPERCEVEMDAGVLTVRVYWYDARDVLRVDARDVERAMYCCDRWGRVRGMRLETPAGVVTFAVTALDDLADVVGEISRYCQRVVRVRFWDGQGNAHF